MALPRRISLEAGAAKPASRDIDSYSAGETTVPI
jgi:hypothetical protein